MVIIDTSAWVDFFRRDGDLSVKLAVKGLLDAFEGALCGPVEMEFLGGARPNETDEIQAWFDVIPYVQHDQKIWRKAARNFAKLRAAGFTVPWNDILIGTIADEKDVSLYANDKHFPIMADVLDIHLYQPGYNGIFNPDS
ncbi:MAG: putative nucleic acid-binding protein [Akkermansiaceae bacterium]|jgi:predicted nucleic acid-binding protein